MCSSLDVKSQTFPEQARRETKSQIQLPSSRGVSTEELIDSSTICCAGIEHIHLVIVSPSGIRSTLSSLTTTHWSNSLPMAKHRSCTTLGPN